MIERLITIKFETQWIKNSTDLRSCYSCDEMIFSDMNTLAIKITSAKEVKTKIIDKVTICNSCKEFIK